MEHLQPAAPEVNAPRCVGCGNEATSERCPDCGTPARAGPYRLVSRLSEGPDTSTFLAEDALGARVALVELRPGRALLARELECFERQVAQLKALSWQHLPRVVRSFTEGAGPQLRLYVAQTFVPGQTLAQHFAQREPSEPELLQLAEQALWLVSHLHRLTPPVVHGALSPESFVLGSDGALYLVDLAGVRTLGEGYAAQTARPGTQGHMASEQLAGATEARSDLFGLGTTLVELLTHRAPDQTLPPPQKLDLDRDLPLSIPATRVMRRLTAVRPEDRYATASDAALAVNALRRQGSKHVKLAVLAAGFAALALGFAARSTVDDYRRAGRQPNPVLQSAGGSSVSVGHDVDPAKNLPLPLSRFELPFNLAHWDFHSKGPLLLDGTGRGHHGQFSAVGCKRDFFLTCDGRCEVRVKDSLDFAPDGPFSVNVHLMLAPAPTEATQYLISRGDPTGKFAWSLAVTPRRMLRFAVADDSGQVATVEGALPKTNPTSNSSLPVYANFDPGTGDFSVRTQCEVLATGNTRVRPRRVMEDGDLRLARNFVGDLLDVSVQRGVWVRNNPGGPGCTLKLDKINEE